MNGTVLHFAFDAIAWLAAGLSLFWLVRTAKVRFPSSPAGDLPYVAALVFGAGGLLGLWLVSFLISFGGAMLIRQAFR
jgi:hypothetical protein